MKSLKWTLLVLLIALMNSTAVSSAADVPADTQDFTGHDAVILETTARFDHVYTYELSMETISYKIKYLTAKGIEDYGFDTVIYDPSSENIGSVDGKVILPDGRTVKISKSDIFEKDIIEKGFRKRTEMKIAFPSLEPGAVVEYSYTRSFEGTRNVSYWPFQSELYTVLSEVTFIPWPGSDSGYSIRNGKVEPEVKESKPGGNRAVTVRRTNIPALPREEYALAYDSQVESIDFYYVDADSGHDDYWTKGVTRIFKKNLKPFMKVCPEARKIVTQEFQNQSPGCDETIRRLFDYVTRNHVSLTMLTKKESQEVDKNYRKKLWKTDKVAEIFGFKYVTDWQINYILASLIQAALPSAKVDLVLYQPWDEGTYDPYLKTIRQFTERMLRVECDGQTFWLDPAKRYVAPGMTPWSMKGIHVLLMNEDNSRVEKIPLEKDTENVSSSTAQISFDMDEGMVTLQRHTTFDRHESYELRSSLLYYSEQERTEVIESRIKSSYGDEAELISFATPNLETYAEPLILDVECRFPYDFEEAGNQILMGFPGFSHPTRNPFLADTRNGPVCYPYPYRDTQEITYTLPAGYKIGTVPQNVRINQNIYIYNITYEKLADNQLRLKRETNLQGNMLKKEAADFFRKTYNDILEAHRKKLILIQE